MCSGVWWCVEVCGGLVEEEVQEEVEEVVERRAMISIEMGPA